MRIVALLILGASLAAPQGPPANAISEIRVEGNQRLSVEEIIRISGLRTGAPAVAATFEAMRDRIIETGCIETVGWKWAPRSSGGFVATIEIAEASQFLPWTVDRLPLAAEDIQSIASKQLPCFGPEIPTSDRYLSRAAALISGLAAARGFEDMVIAKVGITGRDQLSVIFQPRTTAPSISDVRFTGNQAIREEYLRKQMAEVARGVQFSETLFRQFLENQIRPMYENIGHLTVQFGKVTTTPATDVTGVVVTVEVTEGPVYQLEDVEFSGLPLPRELVDELAEYKRDEPVSYSKMALTIEKLFTEMKRRGYLKPEYKAQRKIDPEKLTARLIVNVDPGPQYRMGRLTVRGLDVIGEPVVRKMWTLNAGDPFRDDYPEFFLNTIKDRGVFDFLGTTRAEKKLNEGNRTVDVTLHFAGGAQGLDSRAVPKPKPQP